jgi:NAD(P)H-hydrate epimerase
MPGAALLCATGALRGGAGLVTLTCFDEALLVAAPVARPELILWELCGPVGELEAGLLARAFDVVVAGPGLGTGVRPRGFVEALLASWSGPLVLDADALNMLAAETDLRARVRVHPAPVVITPHPGEAARLLGHGFGHAADERVDAARELSSTLGVVTCLKGAGTVVCDPTGELVWTNSTGNPGMATAGSGDVLAGLLAALSVGVGDTHAAWEAARAAVYLHGLAGDRARAVHGVRGMLAGDLARELGPAELEGPWA